MGAPFSQEEALSSAGKHSTRSRTQTGPEDGAMVIHETADGDTNEHLRVLVDAGRLLSYSCKEGSHVQRGWRHQSRPLLVIERYGVR